MLLTRDREGAIEIRSLLFAASGCERLECDFPGNAMHLGLAPFFLRPFYFVYRVVNATPSIVKLAKFRISHCQILTGVRFIKSCSS